MYCMAIEGFLDPESVSDCKLTVDSWVDEWNAPNGGPTHKTVPLYTTPQPAPAVDTVLREEYIREVTYRNELIVQLIRACNGLEPDADVTALPDSVKEAITLSLRAVRLVGFRVEGGE